MLNLEFKSHFVCTMFLLSLFSFTPSFSRSFFYYFIYFAFKTPAFFDIFRAMFRICFNNFTTEIVSSSDDIRNDFPKCYHQVLNSIEIFFKELYIKRESVNNLIRQMFRTILSNIPFEICTMENEQASTNATSSEILVYILLAQFLHEHFLGTKNHSFAEMIYIS